MRRLLFALALILSASPLQARADMAKFEAALALFNEAALWSPGDGPNDIAQTATGRITRFTADPLRAHIAGATSEELRARAERLIRLAAESAGVRLEIADDADQAHIKFVFFAPQTPPPVLASPTCASLTRRTGSTLLDATIQVRTDLMGCAPHELLHAFGLPGHPHGHDTALDIATFGGGRFSELDRLVLRTLYRAGINPGNYHLAALEDARDFLAKELGVVPPGGSAADLARPFMDAQVARLREISDPFIQMQLGHAYRFGHYVAKDPAEAVRFWLLAAERNQPEAMFELALRLIDGEGIQRNLSRARALLEGASRFGHIRAPRALGIVLREGGGGPRDTVGAYAYFDLAHRRGVAGAAQLRDQLAETFDAATKALAVARAAELPTVPPRAAQ